MAINVKLLLANAIIELSAEKPLSKITVSDVVAKAGTGRQTFYNHFKDKNDLIYWIFCRTLKGEKKILQTAGYFAYLKNLYSEAQNYSRFLKQACALEGQNSLSEAIYEQTYTYYKNYIIEHYGKEAITADLEFSLQFNAHGAASMYIKWADAGMPGTGEEQAILALKCMPYSIKQYLPLDDEQRNEM